MSLKAVIDEAVEESSAVIKGGKHTLDVDLGEDLIVDGDAERLVQVFCNLLTNAAKYTPMGGRIQVSTEKGTSTVTVRVADNGDGIDAHSLPLILKCSPRRGARWTVPRAALGSVLRWSKILPRCMADECMRKALGWARAARSLLNCRL